MRTSDPSDARSSGATHHATQVMIPWPSLHVHADFVTSCNPNRTLPRHPPIGTQARANSHKRPTLMVAGLPLLRCTYLQFLQAQRFRHTCATLAILATRVESLSTVVPHVPFVRIPDGSKKMQPHDRGRPTLGTSGKAFFQRLEELPALSSNPLTSDLSCLGKNRADCV